MVAGAGTGKTRVITERIRHLLESNPELPGESIVGLTFTDKAAAEMKHRVARAAGERGARRLPGHVSRLLQRAAAGTQSQAARPLDNVDHWILLRRNLAAAGAGSLPAAGRAGTIPGRLREFFSRCQDELVTPDDYERYVAATGGALRPRARDAARRRAHLREEEIAEQREIARAYRASDRLLRERNLLTFGMQLLGCGARARRRCRACAPRCASATATFWWTNSRTPTSRRSSCCGGWRPTIATSWPWATTRRPSTGFAARRSAASRFSSNVLPASRAATAPRAAPFVQPLVDNYRSAGAHSARRPGRWRASSSTLRWCRRRNWCRTSQTAKRCASSNSARLAEEGALDRRRKSSGCTRAGQRWRNFAALYRIHAHRDELVEALEERGIPFVIRNLSILNHPLVRDLLAYLRLIARPSRQRRLRASAGGAGVGSRASRSGAALRARGESQELRCGTRCKRRRASCRSAASRATRANSSAGITGCAKRAGRLTPRSFSTRWPNGWSFSCVGIAAATGATWTAWRNSCASGSPRARRRGWRNWSSIWTISRRPAGKSISSRTPAMPCS